MTEPQEQHTTERVRALEARIAALEAGTHERPAAWRPHPAWPLALGLAALAPGYVGLGLPQHWFQPLFAALFLFVAYGRGLLQLYPHPWRALLVALNFLLLLLLFKLLLGGGVSHPFDWLKLPTLQTLPPEDGSWTQRYIPRYQFGWEPMPVVGAWELDLTRLQSLLLLATLAGALFRFQPFASLTALALLLVSAPSYFQFRWDEVVLFLVIGGAALFAQGRYAIQAAPGNP